MSYRKAQGNVRNADPITQRSSYSPGHRWIWQTALLRPLRGNHSPTHQIGRLASARADSRRCNEDVKPVRTAGRSPRATPTKIDPPGGNPKRSPTSLDRAIRSTIATNVALALLGVATGIIAAHLLGPSGEGALTAIQAWPTVLGTLTMLGLDFSLVYFISLQPIKGRQLTSTAIAISMISSLIVGIAAWFTLPLLLSAQRAQIISAARTFLLIGVIYALVTIPRGSLRGAGKFAAWNLFRLAPGIAWLVILISSWLLGHASAVPLSHWYLVGLLACGLPLLFVINRTMEGPRRPDAGAAPQLLRFGLPSALTSLPQTVNLRFDQLLIVAFLPARELGLYVIAVSWSSASIPLLSAVGSVISPNVSAQRDRQRQEVLLSTALQGGALLAIASSTIFTLLAPIALPLIFGARFTTSIPSALVLTPATAIFAWAGVAQEGLRGLGRPKDILVAEIVAAVVTLATLPILIHHYGIFGAAVASLLGYTTTAGFCVYAISHSTRLNARAIVIPTWSTSRLLMLRCLTLLPARNRQVVSGKHRRE